MDKTLKQFLKELDARCVSAFGMAHSDMPDLTYVADMFESDWTVEEVFEACCDEWADDDPLFAEIMNYGV